MLATDKKDFFVIAGETLVIASILLMFCNHSKADVPTQDNNLVMAAKNAPQSILGDTLLPVSPHFLPNIQVLGSFTDNLKETLHKLALCESGDNEKAINPRDTNGLPSFGLFQFQKTTFQENCEGDIFSRTDQTNCAAKLIKQGEAWRWYNCASKIGIINK